MVITFLISINGLIESSIAPPNNEKCPGTPISCQNVLKRLVIYLYPMHNADSPSNDEMRGHKILPHE